MNSTNTSTIENNNILSIKLEIGNNATPVDMTFDTLYIPDKEKYTELSNINFNTSKRPFLHRYKRYNRSLLNRYAYPGVLVYFFDRRKFKELLMGEGTNETANDDIFRENIYLTLYYLFPTGYPSIGNIHFSANKIAGGSLGFAPAGKTGFMNFIMNSNPIQQLNPKMQTSWFQNLWRTFQGGRSFSYIKRDKTYTINEVIWKNDLYNHPTYRKFLRAIYTYISWGERYRKNTVMVSSLGANKPISVVKIDKQIEDVRKEFVISLKVFIQENYKYFCQNAAAYKNLRSIIVDTKSLYLFAEILNNYEAKINSLQEKINALEKEKEAKGREPYDYYKVRSWRNEMTEISKEKSSIETFFIDQKDIINKIKSNAFEITKETTQSEETVFMSKEREQLLEYRDASEKGHERGKTMTDDDKKSVDIIRQKYKERGIVEELKYLKDFIYRKRGRTTDNNSLLEKYAKYVYFLDAKEAIEQQKMVPIQTAYLIEDKYYKSAFESVSELEPIRRLFNTDYREFQRELGGEEGTNPVLNQIIYDFLNGQSSVLAECAIWFHNYVLEDKSLLLEPEKLKQIESNVQSFNSKWSNIYTGIRAEYTTSSALATADRQAPIRPSNSNEFTIYVCANAFDQELNEETLDLFKCYIKNHTLGDMALHMTSQSGHAKEESVREKFLLHSIIHHIPGQDNQTLKEKAKSLRNKTQKAELKKEPTRQQGGAFSKKRKGPFTRKRNPLDKRFA